MRFELNGLRELLEVQLGSLAWNQLQGSKPQQANLWRRLQRIGLSGPLSRDLLALTVEDSTVLPRHRRHPAIFAGAEIDRRDDGDPAIAAEAQIITVGTARSQWATRPWQQLSRERVPT